MEEINSDTESLEPESLTSGEAIKWVIGVSDNSLLNGIMRYKELKEASERAVDEGRSVSGPEDLEGGENHPSVVLKDRLLGLLATVGYRDRSFGSNLMAQLEDRATVSPDTSSMQAYQFTGILEIVASCFTDEDLKAAFEESAPDILESIRALKPVEGE